MMPFVNRAWGQPENKRRLALLNSSSPRSNGFSSVGELMEHLLLCSTENHLRVGEKSPLHIYHVDEILKKFPDAKILITKRDLRGTFFSQAMRSRRNKLSHRKFKLFNLVASWTIASNLADKYFRDHGPEKIRIVQFESLVGNPEHELRDICEFVGAPYEPNMLDVHFENSSFEDVEEKAGIDSTSADRWEAKLDEATQLRLNYLAENELLNAGYSFTRKKPQHFDRLLKPLIRCVNSIALSKPELVCYLGRDSRYRKLTKQYERNLLGAPYGPKLFVLGNHKSGTTAIAKLVAEMCGMPATIDFPRNIRKDGYALARGDLTFEDIVNRHPALFCKELVKIPALTFVASQIGKRFPDSKFLFIVRDPRDNIRSILNRRKIPGNKTELPFLRRWSMKLQNRPSMDSEIWGQNSHGYVGVLSHRWNRAIDELRSIEEHTVVVKYEDFVADKLTVLKNIAEQFDFRITNPVEHLLDKQFQPAGNNSQDWQVFFGRSNLSAIEEICGERMSNLEYV